MGTVASYPSSLNNADSVQSTPSFFFHLFTNTLSFSFWFMWYVQRDHFSIFPLGLFPWREYGGLAERQRHTGERGMSIRVSSNGYYGCSCERRQLQISPTVHSGFSPLPHLIPMLLVCRRSWRWWKQEADSQLLFSSFLLLYLGRKQWTSSV